MTLQCGHVFHGSCIVNSLRRDSRCPVCRDAPNQQDTDSFSSDDEGPYADRRISFRDALKLATTASKHDKKIAKRRKTIAKWKNEIKEQSKSLKHCTNTLRPLEDKLEEKIEAHNKRLWDEFDAKNRAILIKLAEHKQALRRAIYNKRKCETNLAETQGFIPWRRTRRNPRYAENDEVDGAEA